MPALETTRLGIITYEEDSVLDFPRGLPGFENRRRFVAVRLPVNDPLVFLQSLEDPGLCFLTAPVKAVCPDYRMEVCSDDRELLGFPAERRPVPGREIWSLAVLCVRESGPTANLLAPVVVNLENRRAVQAVNAVPGYSHRHALCAEEATQCS
jgi:flagellar assembly factor FliW